MLTTILWFIVVGAVIGALARLIVPGRNPIGILLTILVGIAGSILGGVIADALGAGTIIAIVFAVLIAAARRRRAHHAERPRPRRPAVRLAHPPPLLLTQRLLLTQGHPGAEAPATCGRGLSRAATGGPDAEMCPDVAARPGRRPRAGAAPGRGG
ncbi:GlsB/YeaQ/YmgE family stress response membrane protein [Actinomadura madurae]|uniref:GlsB/YeaQ/YmgE family stress response membrane protein n=1 Tax=Actinomadura madurae TaxID=1993 RepID=UPI0020D210B3|nr:hypothetical protein [Actinomadura madurae]MCP9953975.1 hypothetical protein [Actinomadura madurae]MCP9983191.1 hypothetical protein [Actinomadura madurae]